jgi:UDP-N-acetylmuramoyl-tripeptide--D-alanyl-D-alanine ligase
MNGLDPVLRSAGMMTLGEVARAVGGRKAGLAAAAGAVPVPISGVSTDSRTIAPGELFVALRGERFDGHDHLAECARRGAAAALVAREVRGDPALPQVVVADPRAALGRLAADWRGRFQLPVVALTGSNGKTTVKEMVAGILAAHCGTRDAVLATIGNLNNDIGMPLTLLRLRDHHRYAVLEMGMNHAGEIDYLARIAAPGVAIVINAHRAHVGPLGSLEAVARAKGEIYSGLGPQGIALVNADDAFAPLWRGLAGERRLISFGMREDAQVRGRLEGAQLRLVTPTDAFAVTLQVAGDHNARNAIAACAVASALDIPPHAIQAGLAGFAGVPGRQQRLAGLGGAVLIDDTYNANPESMRAALEVLAAQPGRRLFVMGDMAELGAGAPAMHAEVGRAARDLGIERLLAFGPESAGAASAFGRGAEHFETLEALVAAARREARAGTTILVKGSRSMRMERVAAELAADGGRHAA